MGIRIELSNPNRSYFPGQPIEGRVIIDNTKPDKVKEVIISLKGRGRVQWSGGDGYSVDRKTNIVTVQPKVHRLLLNMRKSSSSPHHAEENYLSYMMVLAGDGENSIIIPEGTNSYPFRFILPQNLPSSFTSHVGEVHYFLKGTIRRSLFVSDDTTRLPFTVNGILDLNQEEWARQPQQYRGRNCSNYCICRTGDLNFDLSLPTRSGFVPGEKIDFKVSMSNRSNRRVIGTKASLQQIAKFCAKGKIKILKKGIIEAKGPSVDKGECKVWEANLNIPGVPPTHLGGICRLIDIQYYLEFEMKISGLSSPLMGNLPVMIGTIPLRTTFGSFHQGVSHVTGMPMPMATSGQPSSGILFNLPNANSELQPKPTGPNHDNFPEKITIPPGYSETVAPTAPVFSDYPDLPPPSYAVAVGAEGFTWNSVETESGHDSPGPGVINPATQPSVPTTY